jgi:hypothetical protein
LAQFLQIFVESIFSIGLYFSIALRKKYSCLAVFKFRVIIIFRYIIYKMDMEAVRLPEQDILSAVMRRQIIIHATPYLSLDPKVNPLFRCGDAVQGLVRTYRGEVRNLLFGLSHGKISISDFSMEIDDMLERIRENSGVGISAFSEIELAVSYIRNHIDTVCAMARSFISSPPGNVDNLGCADDELLRQIEAARAVVSSKAVGRQMSSAIMAAPVVQASLAATKSVVAATPVPEPEKRLQVITKSGGIPLRDHSKYGPMAAKFLLDSGITDVKYPKMTALYNALAGLPLGSQGLSKTVLQKTLGINNGAMGSLVIRLRKKELYLGRLELPQTPGCFIQVKGRELPQVLKDASAKKRGRPVGCYCLGLTLAVEE